MLKKLADKKGIAIVVVHHTKKGVSEDYLESVSGSMGITGAADTIMVLKKTRHNNETVLNITGRDVSEQAIALKFDNGHWIYKGDATEVFMTETQEEILETMRAEMRPLTLKMLANVTGRKVGGFKKTLDRMISNGLISRDEKLFYHIIEVQPKKQEKFERKKASQ